MILVCASVFAASNVEHEGLADFICDLYVLYKNLFLALGIVAFHMEIIQPALPYGFDLRVSCELFVERGIKNFFHIVGWMQRNGCVEAIVLFCKGDRATRSIGIRAYVHHMNAFRECTFNNLVTIGIITVELYVRVNVEIVRFHC
jgi:hypothetical protein